MTSTTIPRLAAYKSKNINDSDLYCHHSSHVYKLVKKDLNIVIFTDSVHLKNVLGNALP